MAETVRLFTVAEARRTLPLVEPVVRDLLAAHGAWREALRGFEARAAARVADDAEAEALQAAAGAVQARAAEVERLLGELEEIGCLFKDFEGGLVDFYSLRDDQLVLLCWRLGEPTIAWWHPVDGGFAGRRPLDSNLLTGTVP